MSRWRVYYWKAGKQFLIGDSWIIVDLLGTCYTVRYTPSRRPKTLVELGELSKILPQAEKLLKAAKEYRK